MTLLDPPVLTAVRVHADDLAPGHLPPVCIKRGVVATDWVAVRFTTTPRWILILLAFGIFPFIVAWLMTRRVAGGLVPVSPEARLAMRRLRVRTIGLGATAVVLLAVAAAVRVAALNAAAIALGLAALVAAVGLQVVQGPAVTVGGTVVSGGNGNGVILRRVHPGFAAAVRRRSSGG